MMPIRTFLSVELILLLAAQVAAVEAGRPEGVDPLHETGRRIYEGACLWCHGKDGRGDGPAGWLIGRYAAPRPRDFVTESFRFRSTSSGELPSDEDLFRTVTRGIPGVMPSFASLTEQQRWAVVAYIKSFNPAFRNSAPSPLTIPSPAIPPTDASIRQGKVMYMRFGCQGCHGEGGTGDGPVSRAGGLQDERGLRIVPPDLTDRASYKNGTEPRDLYRTLMTGLDGTPMPSYAANFEGDEAAVWHLVNYLLSLSPPTR